MKALIVGFGISGIAAKELLERKNFSCEFAKEDDIIDVFAEPKITDDAKKNKDTKSEITDEEEKRLQELADQFYEEHKDEIDG